MCLIIQYSQKPATKSQYVYKVYYCPYKQDCGQKRAEEAFSFSCLQVRSFYQSRSYSLRKGMEITSNRAIEREVTSVEKTGKRIHRGLHVYPKLKDAKEFVRVREHCSYKPADSLVIVRLLADPKDFVARGTFDGDCSSAVYHKLTVHGIVKI